MRYLMLIFLEQERWGKLSADEKNRVHAACGAWHEQIVRSGHSVDCMALQPVSTATTLREKDGKTVITDGPFAETKEVLGGFEVLECKDLDEALAIARRFPGLAAGNCVELRPLMTGPCVD
jgi:hypothetical protein